MLFPRRCIPRKVSWNLLELQPCIERLLDAAHFGAFTGHHESVGDSGLPGPARAANAVNEILGRLWQVVIHDVRDAVHMDAARGYVGRDEDAILAILEALERAIPLCLCAIAVNGGRGEARAI